MIKSEVGHGLIFGGDTPLMSTIALEQTGPMQLTVRAGTFRTTGQAIIIDPSDEKNKTKLGKLTSLKARGLAEDMSNGKIRVWKHSKNGTPVDKCRDCSLLVDTVLNIPVDMLDKHYQIELRYLLDDSHVALLRRIDRNLNYLDATPIGSTLMHLLALPFIVPSGTTDLSSIDIFVIKVLPGFPEPKEEWEI